MQFDFPDDNGRPYKSSGGEMVWNERLKREIPKGWRYSSVGEISICNRKTINRNDRLSDIVYLDTSNITSNRIDNLHYIPIENAPSRAQRKVQHLSILVSTVRPRLRHYGIMIHPETNMIVSTGFATFDAKNESSALYLYHTLTQESIIESMGQIADTAVSAYPSINPSDIEHHQIILPPSYLLNAFHNVAYKIFEQINERENESRTLMQQRDELLPLLINGQASVN